MTVQCEETKVWSWICTDCGKENESSIEGTEILPEELNCGFCDYESGPIDWSKPVKE